MLAGWFYTGGPRPYGYAGFGELFVFVFFGVVATTGTTYVLVERLTWLAAGRIRTGRLPGDGHPGRQQPARHPDGPGAAARTRSRFGWAPGAPGCCTSASSSVRSWRCPWSPASVCALRRRWRCRRDSRPEAGGEGPRRRRRSSAHPRAGRDRPAAPDLWRVARAGPVGFGAGLTQPGGQRRSVQLGPALR